MSRDPLIIAERHEWSGLWWLPEEPDNRMPGVLRYDREDGLSLSLIGAFEDRIMSEPAHGLTIVHEGSQRWKAIHGVAEQRELTLLSCIPIRTKRTLGARVHSPENQTVLAQIALVGVHLADEEDALFAAVQVSVENLGIWSRSATFSSTRMSDGSCSVSANRPERSSAVVNNTEYTVEHGITTRIDTRSGSTTAKICDTSYVQISQTEPCSITKALDSAKSLQDLISLATHRAAGVIWLRLQLGDGGPGAERHAAERGVDVLYSPATIGDTDGNALERHRILFDCASIPFEEILPRWFRLRDRLQAAVNLVLALRYAPAQYLESQILIAAGSAETLHRALSIEDQRDRFKNPDRKRVTLRDRMLDLAGRLDQQAISDIIPNIERWARRSVKARNDLAHEGSTPDHSVDELVAVVQATTAVVIMNLLHELGMSKERQQVIIHEHPQLRATAQMSKEWFGEQEM